MKSSVNLPEALTGMPPKGALAAGAVFVLVLGWLASLVWTVFGGHWSWSSYGLGVLAAPLGVIVYALVAEATKEWKSGF